MHTNSSILLIGSGRLAKHLQYWHQQSADPFKLNTWNRSQDISFLNKFLSEKPIVWLAISDSAIVEFFETHLQSFNLKIVHFSGALSDSRMLSAHPLMSFTEELFESSFYDRIHFVISNFNNLTEAMPGFKNSFSILKPEQKAYYHALCVMAGNFPQLLWNEVNTELRHLNLPDSALENYVQKITENFIKYKEKSITGPLVRKDFVTIEKNLQALEKNQKLKKLYESFLKEFRS